MLSKETDQHIQAHQTKKKQGAPNLNLPKDLGPYRLDRVASASWAGPVWGGIERDTNQPILCLELRADQFSWLETTQWQNFQQTLEGSRLLSHPNVLASYDIFFHTERHLRIFYKAPPTPRGRPETLHDLLLARTAEKLTERDALSAFEQMIAALAALHEQGHRMGLLPPDLFWLDWDKQPLRLRISHYSLQHLLRRANWSQLPQADHLLPYLAPDLQKDADQPIQVHHDLYAAGALLWRMLTGSPLPARGKEKLTFDDLLLHEDLPPLQPVTLQILEKLLHPHPKRRYQNSHTLSTWLAGHDWLQMSSSSNKKLGISGPAAGTLSYTSISSAALAQLAALSKDAKDEKLQTIQQDLWDLFYAGDGKQRTEDLPFSFHANKIALRDTASNPPAPSKTPPSLDSLDNQLDALLPNYNIPEQIPEQWEKEALEYDRKLERKPPKSPLRWLWLLFAVALGWMLWRWLS